MNLFQSAIKAGPALYLYGVGLVFASVLAYQMVTRQPLDPTALALVYGISGFGINQAGVQHGVNVTNEFQSQARCQAPGDA